MFKFSNPIDLRNNSFDFMRLFLAISVVISHAYILGNYGLEPNLNIKDFQFFYDYTTIGGFAVYCFFVISGFLITASWINSNNDWALFLKKRIVRIVPAFWAALLVVSLIVLPIASAFQGFGFVQYLQNYFVQSLGYIFKDLFFDINVWNIKGLFANNPGDTLNGPIWTIKYELYAYLIVVIFGLLGVFNSIRKVSVVFFVFWLSYIAIVFLPSANSVFTSLFGDVRWIVLDAYFFAGSLFYMLKDKISWSWSWFGISLFAVASGILSNQFALVGPLFFGFIVLFLCFRLPFINLTKKFGDYSYGVYIYSWPIQQLMTAAGLHHLGIVIYTILSILLSLGAGYLSWNLVEKKCLIHKSM
jgi:peptidoglycan/LPS O-acetylase OafA/YrhL